MRFTAITGTMYLQWHSRSAKSVMAGQADDAGAWLSSPTHALSILPAVSEHLINHTLRGMEQEGTEKAFRGRGSISGRPALLCSAHVPAICTRLPQGLN